LPSNNETHLLAMVGCGNEKEERKTAIAAQEKYFFIVVFIYEVNGLQLETTVFSEHRINIILKAPYWPV